MNWQDLLKQKLQLSLLQNIPSMAEYADAWNRLAADFEAIGFTACAAECRARFEHYRDLNPGEYIRLIDLPVAELIEVPSC